MNAIVADNWILRHRITVDEYYRMAEVGLLTPDARTELIEGEVIDMAPIGDKPANTVDRLVRLFAKALADDTGLGVQRPIRLSTKSEPQPDLVIYKERNVAAGHPTGADILLVIEVSDSTLRYDREKKAPLYAQHGIPEMWLVDLNRKQLQRLSEPRDGAYQKVETFEGGSIQPLLLSNVSIDLDKILAL